MGKFAVIAIVAIIVIAFTIVGVIMGFRTVEPGEVGVLVTYGKADMVEKESGQHIINPFASRIETVDVSTQKLEAKAGAASKDLQDVSTTVAVNYHIDPTNAAELYSQFKGQFADRIIAPAVQETIKQVTSNYTAAELITKRDSVKNAIYTALENRLSPFKSTVDAVSITQFDFSKDFNKAIEEKVRAQQEAQKAENVLTKIEIEAKQVEAKAAGEKNAAILQAQGQAESAKIINQAIQNSPQYLEFLKLQKWDGVLPKVGSGGEGIGIILPSETISPPK